MSKGMSTWFAKCRSTIYLGVELKELTKAEADYLVDVLKQIIDARDKLPETGRAPRKEISERRKAHLEKLHNAMRERRIRKQEDVVKKNKVEDEW